MLVKQLFSMVVVFVLLLYAKAEQLGYEVVNREKVDTWKRVSYIDVKNIFQVDGKVDAIEIYAGAVGKPLIIAIYQKTGNGNCTFEMLHKVKISPTELGENMITLAEADQMEVKAGNFFGFTWIKYGVVKFDWMTSSDINYCAGKAKPRFNEELTLILTGQKMLSREYSIKLHTTSSEPEPVSEPDVTTPSADATELPCVVQPLCTQCSSLATMEDCDDGTTVACDTGMACMQRVAYISYTQIASVDRTCVPQSTCEGMKSAFDAACASGGPEPTCVTCDAFVCQFN